MTTVVGADSMVYGVRKHMNNGSFDIAKEKGSVCVNLAKRALADLQRTVADYIMEFLSANKVKIVFGYPGFSSMPLYTSMRKLKLIEHVLVRHEQSAAHAAHGYIRATNLPCVCIGSKGPGSTHFVSGIAAAWADCIPLIVITSNVPTFLYGKKSFQECNIIEIVKAITKAAYHIDNAEELPRILRMAYVAAWTHRRGPVLIDVPSDLLQESLNSIPSKVRVPKRRKFPDEYSLSQAAQLLLSAKKPVLICGNGIREDYQLVRNFAEQFDILVVHTVSGTGVVNSNHRLYGGFLRHNGSKHAAWLVQNSDLVIALGTSLDRRCTCKPEDFAPLAKVVHIDIDENELNKNIEVDLPIEASIKDFITELDKKLPEKLEHSDWIDLLVSFKSRRTPFHRKDNTITAQEIVETIGAITTNAIVVTGSGDHKYWTIKHFPFQNPTQFVTSARFGCMGFALPAAIGVSLSSRKLQVLAICGDGDIQMSIGELATARENGCENLKIFIFNNRGLGTTRSYQTRLWGKTNIFETEFRLNLNFAEIGRAYGIESYSIKERDDLMVLARVLQRQGLMLFDCLVDPEESLSPWTSPDTGSLDDIAYA